MSHWRAERVADRIVEAYRPDFLQGIGPFPVRDFFEFHLFERYGLRTGPADLPPGVAGLTRPNGVIDIAGDLYELLESDGFARMTAIHEGVHGIVHRRTQQELVCELDRGGRPILYRKVELPSYENPEWQAARVASAILMPLPSVRRLVRRHGPDADVLVREFLVSQKAAVVRLDQLKRKGWLS